MPTGLAAEARPANLTIARRIAAMHGLQVYVTDDVMADHARRSTPEDSPLLHKFELSYPSGVNVGKRAGEDDRAPRTRVCL
jgi:hypothetical protein